MQKTMISLRAGVLDIRDQLEDMENQHKADIAAIQEDVAAIRAAMLPSPPEPPAQPKPANDAAEEPSSPISPTLDMRF